MLGKIKAWWYMKARKNIKRFWEKLVEKARTLIQPLLKVLIGNKGNEPVDGKPSLLEILGESADVFVFDYNYGQYFRV
jgi:uncharacterized protein (DUF362 family)